MKKKIKEGREKLKRRYVTLQTAKEKEREFPYKHTGQNMIKEICY